MSAVEGEPAIDNDQLSLLEEIPAPGQRWRNVNTGSICAILKVEQRRFAWVTIRIAGSTQTVTLSNFLKHFSTFTTTNGRQR